MKDHERRTVRFFDSRADSSQKGSFNKITQNIPEVQRIRFEAVQRHLQIGPTDSVLDVGCGTGDFYSFLCSQDGVGSYRGIDLSHRLLKIAKERFSSAENVEWTQGDGLTWKNRPYSLNGAFTFVVVTAVFNRRDCSLGELDSLFQSALESAYRMCMVACVVSAHSIYKTLPTSNEAVIDPCWMFQQGKRLTERVVLDHSYAPHDSLIVLWKTKSPFRELWDASGGWVSEKEID